MESIQINDSDQTTKVNLLLIQYQDEKDIFYVYSPQLDLNGYGNTQKEAMDHFNVALDNLLDYCAENNTLSRVLKDLGWKNKNRTVEISKSALRTDELKNIFSNYPTRTSLRTINMSLVDGY